MEISLSLAVKRKLDNSDNTNICYNSKKAKKAKNVGKEEENSVKGGQIIFSEKCPSSSYVEQSPEKKKKKSKRTAHDDDEKCRNIQSMSSDHVDEKMKKEAKNKNKNDNKEDRSLYVSDERESRQNSKVLDVVKNKDKKKKKSKKQKRKELVDSGDLASQLRRDEKVGLLSGQMFISENIPTAHDEEQSPKKKKKKSRRTVQEDDEKCRNTHTMPSDQVDEIPTANDEEQSPKKKKKKKKSKRTAQEAEENCKNILMMSRDQADEKMMKKEKKKGKIDNEEDRSIYVSEVRESRPSCQHLEDIMGCKDKKRKKSKKQKIKELIDSSVLAVQASGRVVDDTSPNIFEFPMRKKKNKRSKEMERGKVLTVQAERVKGVNDLDNGRELSVSSKSSLGRNKLFKLSSKSDLNLLSNPVEDEGIIIHPDSRKVDDSLSEYILPDPCVSSLTLHSSVNIPGSCISYPEASGLVLDQEDRLEHEQGRFEESVISAASRSWHVPVTPKNKSHLKSIAKEAVSEVLSGSVGSLEENSPHGSKLNQRRSLVNYELLCKTGSSTDRKVLIDDDSKTVGQYYENNNNESSKITSTPIVRDFHDEAVIDPMAKKVLTIKDLYKLPKRKKVPPVIYDACKFIFSQQVPVSDVNRAYTGHCVPGDMDYRKLLKRKYKAKFGKYYEEQDEMLMKRFNILVQNGIVANKEEFCTFLNTYCSGNDKKELAKNKRNIGVRNIIGLFIGQDMPRKIAAVHCLRLIKLVLGHSYLFKHREEVKKADLDSIGSLLVEPADNDLTIPDNDDADAVRSHNANQSKKRIAKKWTPDEDKFLIEWVIRGSGPKVEDVDPMKVDWEGASESLERDIQNVREHWSRTIQPVLLEDVEPVAILMFRKELLEEVVKSKAGNRRDIDWASLATIFRPRSTYAISGTFHDLMRGSRVSSSRETSEEFRERVNLVLSKVIRNLALPEAKMAKCVRKTSYKKELQEYYWNLQN